MTVTWPNLSRRNFTREYEEFVASVDWEAWERFHRSPERKAYMATVRARQKEESVQ